MLCIKTKNRTVFRDWNLIPGSFFSFFERFITAGGIRICVSPNQKWVQAAIKRIDESRPAKRK